jgi:hypothetical protein
MAPRSKIGVYVEVGPKRCFAAAIEWPGWCRSAADEEGALQALVEYLPRYESALGDAGKGLPAAPVLGQLRVEERVEGDATTDFGTPGAVPRADHRALTTAELKHQLAILEECWRTFDACATAAEGRQLATGPRGGGRSLEKMRAHLDDGDRGYLGRLGGRLSADSRGDSGALRAAFVEAVAARARGEVSDTGPRGGVRWPARYGIRRSAWHALDHAWEIEDRTGTRRI